MTKRAWILAAILYTQIAYLVFADLDRRGFCYDAEIKCTVKAVLWPFGILPALLP